MGRAEAIIFIMSKKSVEDKSQKPKTFKPLFHGDTPEQYKTLPRKIDYRRKPKSNRWEDWSDE
jgi:hypothetical protein